MRVCVYLEFEGPLAMSGIATAVKNQRKALELNGVKVTSDPGDEYDVLHINTIGPRSLYLAKKMKKKGKKVVLHAHTTAENFKESFGFSNQIAPLLKKYLGYFYNQGHVLICPSNYAKSELASYGLSTEIKVVSNGVDVEKFKADEEKRREYRAKFRLDGIVPFCVGNVFARKGISTFAEVGSIFPEHQFIWFGPIYSGPLRSRKVGSVLKKTTSNVRFVGRVEDIIVAYSAGDIFFLPTHHETQGVVVLEAASCGKPILVRDLPVFEGWLQDGLNCLKATEEEFPGKLERLLEDPRLRKKLGENARKLAEKHSLREIGKQLIEAYGG